MAKTLIPFKGWYPGYKGAPPAGAGGSVYVTEEEYAALKPPVPTPPVPTPTPPPTVPTPSAYTGPSIVDYLKSVGQLSDFASRATLAQQQGIANYTGTGPQNTQLLNTLRGGAAAPQLPTPTTPTAPVSPTPAPGGAGLQPVIPDAAVDARNAAADAAHAAATAALESIGTGDVDVRDSASILAGIQEMMEGLTPGGAEAPEAPSLGDLYEEKRIELGIEPLETELAGIESDIEAIQANLLIEAEKAGERLVGMREIGRRRGTLQREADRRTALLNIEKSAVSRILNNKLNSLRIVMDLTGQDFANASAVYTAEFNKNIAFYNLLAGAEQRELTNEARLKTDARANLMVISNIFTKANVVWADLSEDNKRKIKELEIAAEHPEGMTEALLSIEPEKEKSFQVVSDDKTQVTIFYKDNTSQTFNTGITPSDGFTTTQKQKLEAAGLLDAPREEQLAHLFPADKEAFLTEEFITTAFAGISIEEKAESMGKSADDIEEMLKAMGKERKEYAKFFQTATTEEKNIEADYEKFIEDAFPDYITNTLMPMVKAYEDAGYSHDQILKLMQ